MLTSIRFAILFYMFLNPGFKMMISIFLELRLAQVSLYTRKDFNLSGIESLSQKQFLILNEVKISLMLNFFADCSQSFESFMLILFQILVMYGKLM